MNAFLHDFHFLRPAWFIALPFALWLCYLLHRRAGSRGNWPKVIDSHLLPHLVEGGIAGGGRRWQSAAAALGCALAIAALAGPAWEKIPQPAQQREDALVILFDQSLSMLAADLAPSRLTRARRKIIDLLRLREEGDAALVAYAGDAHVVSPLTDDDQTLINLLPALEPGIMPIPGSRPSLAVAEGLRLFQDAGAERGKLLLLTDGARRADIPAIQSQLAETDYELHIIGVGTPEGAPVPVAGGYLKDRQGDIVIARLDAEPLLALAAATGGAYSALRLDDRDIAPLIKAGAAGFIGGGDDWAEGRSIHRWQDRGYWLLPLLLPIVLAGFRRGWLLALALLLPAWPQTALALEWRELWQNRDQRGAQLLEEGDAAAAARIFADPDWAAAAHYRAGDYDAALARYQAGDGADDWYNRGNALARQGYLRSAIAAYDEALARAPGMEDAVFNKELVERLLEQQEQEQEQQQSGGGGQQGDEGEDGGEDGDDGDGERGGESGQGQQGQSGDNQQSGESGQSASGDGDQSGQEQDSAQANGQDGEQSEQSEQGQDGANQTAQRGAQPGDEAGEDADRNDARGGERESPEDGAGQAQGGAAQDLSSEERERQAASEQWLRRIPDDPSGLLRRKFEHESRERRHERRDNDEPAW